MSDPGTPTGARNTYDDDELTSAKDLVERATRSTHEQLLRNMRFVVSSKLVRVTGLRQRRLDHEALQRRITFLEELRGRRYERQSSSSLKSSPNGSPSSRDVSRVDRLDSGAIGASQPRGSPRADAGQNQQQQRSHGRSSSGSLSGGVGGPSSARADHKSPAALPGGRHSAAAAAARAAKKNAPAPPPPPPLPKLDDTLTKPLTGDSQQYLDAATNYLRREELIHNARARAKTVRPSRSQSNSADFEVDQILALSAEDFERVGSMSFCRVSVCPA